MLPEGAVYCWENFGCGKRLLCLVEGRRVLDVFPCDGFYEKDSEEVDLPPDFDATVLPVYGGYDRREAPDEAYEADPDGNLDTYTPVGPRLSVDEIKALLAQDCRIGPSNHQSEQPCDEAQDERSSHGL